MALRRSAQTPMTFLESWFDKIICINRDARTDRWQHCLEQFKKHGLTKVERFSAHDQVVFNGWKGGNGGCTASHRAVLEIIAYHKWNKALILEDDFTIRFDDYDSRFEQMVKEVPDDWEMLYLGGHYAEAPQYRVSQHVIRIAKMMTTSSYAVTWQFARMAAPYIGGPAPIESFLFEFHLTRPCYIFQPRLMVQYESKSDLTGLTTNNALCMEDETHENMV